MAKTSIINVEVNGKINTAYVTYSSGTEKLYPANKLPKTVQAWLEAKAEEEKREAAAEKRRTAFAMRDRHEDVTTYTEWKDQETRLTEEELAWFHETVDRCKAATGCTVPITTFDHEIFSDQSKEALGQCITNNPDNPLEGDSQITIDNWFIHEKYQEAFEDFPCIEPQTLIGTICHEIAHLYVWEHGEDHDRKTQELLAMVEAYGAFEAVVEQAVRKLPATTQKPELTVPVEAEIVKDNSMGAAEAVAFGTCIAMAIAFWGIAGLIQVLAAGIETLACWAWSRREQAAAGCRTAVRWIGSRAKAMAACLPTVTTRRGLLVAVRVLPVLIGVMALM